MSAYSQGPYKLQFCSGTLICCNPVGCELVNFSASFIIFNYTRVAMCSHVPLKLVCRDEVDVQVCAPDKNHLSKSLTPKTLREEHFLACSSHLSCTDGKTAREEGIHGSLRLSTKDSKSINTPPSTIILQPDLPGWSEEWLPLKS